MTLLVLPVAGSENSVYVACRVCRKTVIVTGFEGTVEQAAEAVADCCGD